MTTDIFYVYQYVLPDGTPYYIGKGSKDRINESHMPWVEIPSKEFRKFIKTNMSEQDAFDLELKMIKHYGRKIDGGILDNVKLTRWVAQAGWKHSNETKEKISKANKGRVYSEEMRAKYQKPKSKEHAEKIRQANLGRKDDGRHVKIGKTMSLKRWYNNGQISRMFVPGQELEGFYPGRSLRNIIHVMA
jgi:hypothetical protein